MIKLFYNWNCQIVPPALSQSQTLIRSLGKGFEPNSCLSACIDSKFFLSKVWLCTVTLLSNVYTNKVAPPPPIWASIQVRLLNLHNRMLALPPAHLLSKAYGSLFNQQHKTQALQALLGDFSPASDPALGKSSLETSDIWRRVFKAC